MTKRFIDLTAQEIADSYEKSGLKPIRSSYYEEIDGVKCGCALTSLITSFSQEQDIVKTDHTSIISLVCDHYEDMRGFSLTSFTIGFDGGKPDGFINGDATLQRYFDLGVEVAKLVEEKYGEIYKVEIEEEEDDFNE